MNIVLKRRNILVLLLSIILTCLVIFIFISELSQLERIIIPFLVSLVIALFIHWQFKIHNKDRFVSKIFLISILVHFIFILFWQVLKYYILGLNAPTENTFNAFISDNDATNYHAISVYISNNYNIDILSNKYYGGLFPKLVGTLYYIFGTNPFIVTCVNSIFASFISVLVYVISKRVLTDINRCKIYSLLCIFSTSYIVHSSVVIRDGYITLFMYLSIFVSYLLYKTKKILYLILLFISLYLLYAFRPYAAIMVVLGIALGLIFKNIKFEKTSYGLKMNKSSVIFFILSPFGLGAFLYGLNYFISNTKILHNELSVESLINIRETAYAASTSTYAWDFNKLYHIFPLLPFVIGYLCLFLAPFPIEWFYLKRIHCVPDMLILYSLLPSFIKNIKLVFTEKNYCLLVYFFTMICMFTIYCIMVGNSGTIFRLRGPYIPMIYLIALYRPDKYLGKILATVQKRRIV